MNINIENAVKEAVANLEKSNLEGLANDFLLTKLIPVKGDALITDEPNPNK